ncbi:unnamed protein product, partial [Tetraodon nigroviridis]
RGSESRRREGCEKRCGVHPRVRARGSGGGAAHLLRGYYGTDTLDCVQGAQAAAPDSVFIRFTDR